jgi:FdhE protein
MSSRYSWKQRIERARELAESLSYARSSLTFYSELLVWQKDVFESVDKAAVKPFQSDASGVDEPPGLGRFASLLDFVQQRGSKTLAGEAQRLRESPDSWDRLLKSYWNSDPGCEESFFARACLQPYYERRADITSAGRNPQARRSPEAAIPSNPFSSCPSCGRKPQLAMLSDEPDMPGVQEGASGAFRFLMCGDCLTVWPFPRIACAGCGEREPTRLPYYSSEALPYLRVECCDSCRHYLKAVDLTSDRRPIPPVDELGAIPLDLWAQERGYTKIRRNLVGM